MHGFGEGKTPRNNPESYLFTFGKIPGFAKILATARKYAISIVIVVQSLAQVKDMYDKLFEAVIGCCDTLIFLGGNENETCKYISEKLGKTTIRNVSNSHSTGRTGNYSISQNLVARDLLSPDEVSKIDNDMSIVIVRGLDPFIEPKYSLFEHPNYYMCGDADPENMVGEDFLNKYYTCTSKDMADDDDADEENKKAEMLMKNETIPETMEPVTTEQKPLNNLKDMAEATNAEEETEEAVAERLTVKGDETAESDGPAFMKDITGNTDENDDYSSFGMDGMEDNMEFPEGTDFDDPFSDTPDMNVVSETDATDYGMTGFNDDSDSPESMSMAEDSMKWLMVS